MSDTLLNQILQNQNRSSEQIGRISEIVKRHDEVTFPDMQNTLTRMESKSNQDYLQYVKSREEFDSRLKPLEEDMRLRMERADDMRKGWRSIMWNLIEKIVVMGIGAIIAMIMSWKFAKSLFS